MTIFYASFPIFGLSNIKNLCKASCSLNLIDFSHSVVCSISEYKFAMWSIRGIVVSSDAFTMQPSEYKSIKERYIIKPLYIEDIDEAGQQFQFRER